MTHKRRELLNIREQARRMIWKHQAIGRSRRAEMGHLRAQGLAVRGTMSTGQIHSHATLNRYTSCWARIGEWTQAHFGIRWMNQIRPEHVAQFMREQAERGASQKTINNYITAARFGIATATQRSFHDVRIETHKGKGPSMRPRAYTAEQIARIRIRQSSRHALATRIVEKTGIRAEELWTLRRVIDPIRLAAWNARTLPDAKLLEAVRLPQKNRLGQAGGTVSGYGDHRQDSAGAVRLQNPRLILRDPILTPERQQVIGGSNVLDQIGGRPGPAATRLTTSSIKKGTVWSSMNVPWPPGEVIEIAWRMQNDFGRELHALRARRAAEVIALERQFYGRSVAVARPYPQPEYVAGQRRVFHPLRFVGLEGGELYLVTGKGGLVREIVIPADLARELEAYRLATPKIVRDRDGRYEVEYDMPGGRRWERSFSRASQLALGFSCGGHGLRHCYVQDRFRFYLEAGYSIHEAKAIAATEVGHFRSDVTDMYRR